MYLHRLLTAFRSAVAGVLVRLVGYWPGTGLPSIPSPFT